MKTYGGVHVYIHIFLTSALDGGEWWASRPGRLTPGERAPGTHSIWVSMGPRTGLDDVESIKILLFPGLEIRTHGCAAHSQSLHRLRYPVSLNFHDSLVLKFRVETRSRQGGRCVRELWSSSLQQISETFLHLEAVKTGRPVCCCRAWCYSVKS
jgi:hypothetical protein